MTIHLTDRMSVLWKTGPAISGNELVPATDFFDAGTMALPIEDFEVFTAEPELRDRGEVRNVRGRRRSYRIGPKVGGKRVPRRTSSVSVQMVVRGLGTGDPDSHPLHEMLSALLEDGGNPTWSADAVQAYHDPAPAGTDETAFYFHPEDVSNFSEGDLLSVDIDGRPVPLWVVDVDDTADAEYVQVQGAPRHLTAGDTVRSVRTWRLGNPNERPVVNMCFDKDGWRYELFEARPTEVKFSVEPRGDAAVWVLDWTFDARFVRTNHANASISAPVSAGAGPELQYGGGDTAFGAALPADTVAGPYAAARVGQLLTSQVEITLAVDLAEAPDQRTVNAGQTRIRDIAIDGRVRLSHPMTDFDRDLDDDVDRWWSMAIGSAGAGEAFVIFVPNAICNADRAGRGEEDGTLVQDLVFESGMPRGTATASAADSPFLLGLVS